MFLEALFELRDFMFEFWGSPNNKSIVDNIIVRSNQNFNWTFIFILAVVFCVYWDNIKKKNFRAIEAGLALYGVHWLYEIANAIIAKVSGYPLWAVTNDSTTFILLIGVCWELSMMFALAGIISFNMLPDDPNTRYLAKGKFKGFDCKFVGALSMALLFALFESFLAATSINGVKCFVWVYEWWGVIPVFITTYVPFFLASNYVPFMKPKARKIFLIVEWSLVAVLLVVLIACKVI